MFTVVPGDPPHLEPDRFVEVTATDYFRRRDPVLESIVAQPQANATSAARKRRAVNVGPVCPQ